jgi:hypothetical protein
MFEGRASSGLRWACLYWYSADGVRRHHLAAEHRFHRRRFASLYDGGDMEIDPQPYYSISIAK